MTNKIIDITVIVPVYNEEGNIRPFLNRTIPILKSLNITYEIIFCVDPCTDNTIQIINQEINKNKNIKALIFSRKFGQPAATFAGIKESDSNYVVIIDVDLQDPPELITQMYMKAKNEEYDVVYAKRKKRKGESFVKLAISAFGYYLINKLSDINIPQNTGDFRIMSRGLVDHLKNFNEMHGFLRGLVAYIGLKQTFIEYDRDERYFGKGNYNRYVGSLKIGLNGIIAFSSKPLFFLACLGFLFSLVSFSIGIFYLYQKLAGFNITPGLPTTVLIVTFFSGLNLLGLGLIGEYVGRIYDEVKRRPMYIIKDKINFK